MAWAVGYNVIALPIAAGVFQAAFGLVLRPEIAALSMSGSRGLVAVDALLLKRHVLARVVHTHDLTLRGNGVGAKPRQSQLARAAATALLIVCTVSVGFSTSMTS